MQLQFTAMRHYAPTPLGELTALPRHPGWVLFLWRGRKEKGGWERERKEKARRKREMKRK